MIVTLRTLTEKSVIGFGHLKTTTVGDLLRTRQYKDLISLYYNLERITFCDDILRQLYLNDPEFAILKPGKSREHFEKFSDMLLTNLEFHNNAVNGKPVDSGKSSNILDPRKRKMHIRSAKDCSKMLNRNKTQRGY